MTYADTEQLTRGAAWALPATLRRVLLLAPPLALAVLEFFHPAPDVNAQAVMEVATWFAVFHAIQLVLIGLVGAVRPAPRRQLRARRRLDDPARDRRLPCLLQRLRRRRRDQHRPRDADRARPPGRPAGRRLGHRQGLARLRSAGLRDQHRRHARLGGRGRRTRAGRSPQGAPRSQWILIGLAAFFLLGGHPFPGGTFAFASLFMAALLVVSEERRESRPSR